MTIHSIRNQAGKSIGSTILPTNNTDNKEFCFNCSQGIDKFAKTDDTQAAPKDEEPKDIDRDTVQTEQKEDKPKGTHIVAIFFSDVVFLMMKWI